MARDRQLLAVWLLLQAASGVVWTGEWTAQVVEKVEALVTSCVVIPCSFTHPETALSRSKLLGSWFLEKNQEEFVYHEQTVKIIPNFRHRTELALQLEEGNCTLKITDVKNHDSGPFCFRVEMVDDDRQQHSFLKNCAHLIMLEKPRKPKLSHPETATQGQPYAVTCSVTHTCPAHRPTLTWSRSHTHGPPIEIHKDNGHGTWEMQSILTFLPEEKDDHTELSCTAAFNGGKTSSVALKLYVKRFLLWGCESWVVRIPSHIQSLRGSCLVIPCSYSYEDYPPQDPDRVVWYQYVSRGYPLVFDNTRGREVIQKFKGKTSRVRSGKRDCSLQIQPVANDHHMEKIYPWVDPDHVGYRTYKFYESTVTIHVHDKAEKPVIEFFGDLTVGQLLAVRCSVVHSCSSFPPTLTLSIKPQEKRLTHDSLSDGSTRTTLAAKFLVDTDHQKVSCSVRHSGGLQAEATESFQAKCSYQPLRISSQMFLEGKASQVTCTAEYTCQKNTPTFSWNYREMPARSEVTPVAAGHWRALSTLTFTAAAKDQDRPLTCTARFTGGHRQEESTTIQVKSPCDDVLMAPPLGELMEGVVEHVTCSVSYKCKKVTPSITWSHGDTQSTMTTLTVSQDTYTTTSNLTFVPSLDDNGKLLTCAAQFTSGVNSEASTKLLVKNSQLLAADVFPRVPALTGSCVVIPCTFQPQGDATADLQAVWYSQSGGHVYHDGQSKVLDHFKGRTKILGDVSKKNCTLEIDNIKSFDNGPFCFRAERGNDKYRFSNSCVFIIMQERPLMSAVPREVDAGSEVNVTCSVKHTCPSQPPVLTWSNHTTSTVTLHIWRGEGLWETSSTASLLPELGDGPKVLSCTATFWGGKAQTTSAQITVKGWGPLKMFCCCDVL
ncbi:unnamed protein product [Merluccius merluccius]